MFAIHHNSENTDQSQELVEEIIAGIDGEDQTEQPAQNIYHIYVVKQATEEPVAPVEAVPQSLKKHSWVLIVCIFLLLTGTGAGIAAQVFFLTPTTTVTIFPEQKELTTTTTVSLVLDTPKTAEQIKARLLPTLTMTQQQTVVTTGTGEQAPTNASGTLTFYNAAPFSQFIPAGTLIIAANGNQVVTDQDATLPAANMPIVGQVSVLTHAVLRGTAGNMQVGAIDSPCCLVNVFVKNTTAFTGGQNARSFPIVTKQDKDYATKKLQTALLHSMQAAMQIQIKPDETLVTPLACTPTVTLDHEVGTEAKALTVTMSQTCKAVAYQTKALQTYITAIQTKESIKKFGSDFVLIGVVQPTITSISHTKQGLLILTMQTTGTWAYQFAHRKLEDMKQTIAGKDREQATAILLQVPGVDQVSLEETGALPTHPEKIQIVVLYKAAPQPLNL